MVRYDDWGERSPRWGGIRSRSVVVDGVTVHYLSAGTRAGTPHLLVHPMGASATWWLDVIPALAAHAPVVAPDLPGSALGDTAAAAPRDAAAGPAARFLHAFGACLDLTNAVVHGWSMGALAAVLFASAPPRRASALVLTAAPLPPPLTRREALGWRTVGRAALVTVPPVARGVLRIAGPRLVDRKLAASRFRTARVSPDLAALLDEQLRGLRDRPERLSAAVHAFASVVSARYVDRAPVERAIDAAPPALVLCGDGDPLAEPAPPRRTDWRTELVAGAGHLLPMEVPDDYVARVDRWLGRAH